MENSLLDIMNGREHNHLLPFLWMRQGKRNLLPGMVRQIYDSGARALCVESRPHEAFCQQDWWDDMDVVLAEAQKLDMKVWVLDDRFFPTGRANGLIAKQYPHLRKWQLVEEHVDVVGPAPQNAMLLRDDAEDILLGVYAYGRKEEAEVLEPEVINLTDYVRGRYVYWDIPAGVWRVMALYKTRRGTQQTDYIHLIDPASVDVLLEAVYEPHYAHYSHLFGSTIAGFFSDEPSLGNCQAQDGAGEVSMYNQRLGQPGLALPWTDELLACWKERFGPDAAGRLAALWYEQGADTPEIRVAYMDILTGLWRKNFTGRIGKWCRDRGVEYIGHVIEDMNAHARMGWSAGHYFRALDGQDMAGIDVVLHQIMPGLAHYRHATIVHGGVIDPVFFQYVLARMAVSLSHIHPRMKNRTMCEIFGAFGWAEGVPFMKRLMDHMLVRGVNYYVPHAFSPDYPDPDCPPHFNAGGCNPQFSGFTKLMRYTNRVCHLLEGATEVVSAAVLYHAEAEWSGRTCMLTQEPARRLYDAQLNYDILPMDALLEQAWVEDGMIRVREMRYPVLLVPGAAWLPQSYLRRLEELETQGAKIAFVGEKPGGCGCPVIAPEETAAFVRAHNGTDVRLTEAFPMLRTAHYRRDGADVFMLVNESMEKDFHGAVVLPVEGFGTKLNLLEDACYAVEAAGGVVPVELCRGQSTILVFGTEDWKRYPAERTCEQEIKLNGPWTLTKQAAHGGGSEGPAALEYLYNVTGPEGDSAFSGWMRYETVFTAPEGAAKLDLGLVGECARVWLNGVDLGERIHEPYTYEIASALCPGENKLLVEVTNSLVHQQPDEFSRYMQIPPSGLLGPVRVRW
ncbi:MAG: glycosyl transferase family 2 [Clostridia bacterium]|nr:glycosyl transferase family 2 [Clostridia bacterium]